MKQLKIYIFLASLALVGTSYTTDHHTFVLITPQCARALNMLYAMGNSAPSTMLVEDNMYMSIEDAQSIIEDALIAINSMESCPRIDEMVQTLRAYYHNLATGLHAVDRSYITKNYCKVLESACIRNLLRVGGSAQIAKQASAGCMSASTVTTNIVNTESVTAFVLDGQVINATSISVAEINGLPLSASGLSVAGPQGATGPQGVTGNTGPDGNAGVGSSGPMGAPGVLGNTGIQGTTGNTGPQGIRGNTGPDGGFSGAPAGYVNRFNRESGSVGAGGFNPVRFFSSAIPENGWNTGDNITFTCQVPGLYKISASANFLLPEVNELIRVGLRILTNVGDNNAYYGRTNQVAPIAGGVSVFLTNSALINCVVGTTIRIEVTASVPGVIIFNPASQSAVNNLGQAANLIIRRVF